MGDVLRDRDRNGSIDLEAAENLVKDEMMRMGARIIEYLLNQEDGSKLGRNCSCGGKYIDKKRGNKILMTVQGDVGLIRSYQRCNRCGQWRTPQDIVLDIENTGFLPGLKRMMAKTGAELCFDKARNMIWEIGRLRVTDKDVERIAEEIGADVARREEAKVSSAMADKMEETKEKPSTLYIAADGTGVPVLRRETEGRAGKADDGIARTREAKLGVVFTQSKINKESEPVRDEQSSTYVGKIETAEDFMKRLYAEARQRGLDNAKKVAFIADGAQWLWDKASEHFSQSVQILDYYHAAEHIGDAAKLLYPDDEVGRKRWTKKFCGLLWEGKVNKLISYLNSLELKGKIKEKARKIINYFDKNRHRMRYDEFRREGFFIGSGVVEAGCKNVIGLRLKQSGMHWTVRGANAVIALRCCIESGKFEDYWESRRAA